MFARTPRLLLRPGFPEDAPALAAAMSDKAIERAWASDKDAVWPSSTDLARFDLVLPARRRRKTARAAE